MKKTLYKSLLPSAAFFLPLLALAQDTGAIEDLIEGAQDIVNALIPLAAGIALLAFFWGLAKYIFQADDEEAQEAGKKIMIGGIIALFLIAAVGGIVEVLSDVFGVDTNETIDPTNIDTSDN